MRTKYAAIQACTEYCCTQVSPYRCGLDGDTFCTQQKRGHKGVPLKIQVCEAEVLKRDGTYCSAYEYVLFIHYSAENPPLVGKINVGCGTVLASRTNKGHSQPMAQSPQPATLPGSAEPMLLVAEVSSSIVLIVSFPFLPLFLPYAPFSTRTFGWVSAVFRGVLVGRT